MQHTIDDAASLVGITRRSIYRAMDAGRLSYSVRHDGRRVIDTAELLRAYGQFRDASQPVTLELSHGVTPSNEAQAEAIAAAVAKGVAQAVAPLIERLGELEATLRLLEYRPEPSAPVEQPPDPWSDLIASLKARH